MARKTQEIKRETFTTDEEFVDALIGTFSALMQNVAQRNRASAIALVREGWNEEIVRLELMSNIVIPVT